MPSAKRYLLIAFSFVVALTAIVILNPRTVHAITAALVQVSNTSAAPVPQEDAGTRFQAAVCNVAGGISTAVNPCPSPTNVPTFTVPTTTSTGAPVRRLIVENVSGYCSNYGSNAVIMKFIRLRGQPTPDADSNGNPTFTHYIPLGAPYSYVNDATWGPPLANEPENDYGFGQTTKFAFNPGDTVSLELFDFQPSTSNVVDAFCIARVEGYLVTN